MKAITQTQKGLQKLQIQSALKKINKIKEGAAIFLVLTAVIVIGTSIFHTYPSFAKLQDTKKSILEAEYNIKELQENKKDAREALAETKDTYDKLEEKIRPKMNIILPEDEEIYLLTNFLEDYAVRYNSEENPLVLNNISYGKPKLEGNYFVLPIRTNVQVSRINFLNLLTMINQSGSMKEDDYFRGQPIRLMTIESLAVSVPQAQVTQSGKKSVLTYPINLEINTYFQAKKEDKEATNKKPNKK